MELKRTAKLTEFGYIRIWLIIKLTASLGTFPFIVFVYKRKLILRCCLGKRKPITRLINSALAWRLTAGVAPAVGIGAVRARLRSAQVRAYDDGA